MNKAERERRYATNYVAKYAALMPLLNALRHIDWMQIILNQSAPCCFIEDEDGRFCGRAERWAGHEHFHKFISLDAAIDAILAGKEGK